MDRNEIICNCMDISRGEIVDVVEQDGLKTVEEVGEATSAGAGCGACQDLIQEILDEVSN